MRSAPGSLKLGAELGRGGMGVVHRATDLLQGAEVAVKRLPPELAGSAARLSRLRREARVLARISHPGVARLHRLERLEGELVIVMELVRGVSLRTLLQEGALDVRRSGHLIGQAAETMAAVHACGIVHRDMKPENLMVTPADSVKVLDFGLALDVDTDAEHPEGTPDYMAPEQLTGAVIDERTDVWALGCVLYECVTGRRPFANMPRVLFAEPDWARLPSEAPAGLKDLIGACLAKSPGQRLETARRLADELEHLAKGVPATLEVSQRSTSGRRRGHGHGGLLHGALTLVSVDVPPARSEALRERWRGTRVLGGADDETLLAFDRQADARHFAQDLHADLRGARRVEAASELARIGIHQAVVGFERTPDGLLLVSTDARATVRSRMLDAVGGQTRDDPRRTVFGRDEELDQLLRGLSTGGILTLRGPGGVGKTTLAREVVARHWPHRRTLFADLTNLDSGTNLVAAVARQIGLEREDIDAVAESLSSEPALLTLDNCERLVPACRALAEQLLERVPSQSILATSRHALEMPREVILDVAPLSLRDAASADDLRSLAAEPAVGLFLARAAEARPGFTLDDTNARQVMQVCRTLDGLPLALELAAARLSSLSLSSLAKRLDDCVPLLRDRGRPVAQHRSLAAVVDWSRELLTTDEATLFRRLAVFRGGWDLELAGEVCGFEPLDELQVESLLGQLVAHSLVVVRGDAAHPRFGFLETIRSCARDLMDRSGEVDELRHRHARALQERLELGADFRLPSSQFAADAENVCAALDWTMATGQRELGLDLALASSWLFRSAAVSPRPTDEQLMAALSAVSADMPAHVRGRALRNHGQLLFGSRGRIAEAIPLLEESIGLLAGAERLYSINCLLLCLLRTGRAAEARKLYEDAVQSDLDEVTPLYWRSILLVRYAHALIALGEPGAVRVCEQAYAVAQSDDPELGVLWPGLWLGVALEAEGRFDEAMTAVRRSVALERRKEASDFLVPALSAQGRLHLLRDELHEAVAVLEEALEQAREPAIRHREIRAGEWLYAHAYLAVAMQRLHRETESTAHLRTALLELHLDEGEDPRHLPYLAVAASLCEELRGAQAIAAQMLGAARQLLTTAPRRRTPPLPTDALERRLEASLGRDRLAREFAAGAALTRPELLALALERS